MVEDKWSDKAALPCFCQETDEHDGFQQVMSEPEARYCGVVESSSDAIMIMNVNRNILSCNQAFVELFGYKKNEVERKSVRIIHTSDEQFSSFADAAYPVVRAVGSFRTEWDFRRKDGVIIPTETVTSALRNSEGLLIGYVAIIRDITKRKEYENTLNKKTKELEARIRELDCFYNIFKLVEEPELSLDEILQGIVNLIPVSTESPQMTCARLSINDCVFQTHPFVETAMKISSQITLGGKEAGKLEVFITKEHPELDKEPLASQECRLVEAITKWVARIVERIKAREALQESEKRFRDLVENSYTGICIYQDGKPVYCNFEQERIFGQKFPIDLTNFPNVHPEDVQKVSDFFANFLEKGEISDELEFRYYPSEKDGNKLPVKWFYCRLNKIDYYGKESILVNMMDVTKLKEMERLLQVKDKMASLGHVAAGIAHEIRNPLSGINIYLTALERMYKKSDSGADTTEIFEQLHSASNKIAAIIKRVMDFSKPGAPKFEPLDINNPIQEALDLCSVTLRKSGISVEKDLCSDLCWCKADPTMIEEVIMNLITNASEALREAKGNKKIRVKTASEADRMIISIADSGPGVSQTLREKIFDPFFTTKKDGTGLGLSICNKIIAEHRGSIGVFNSSLGGAEFRIEIPVTQ